jgi:hypothetical protein
MTPAAYSFMSFVSLAGLWVFLNFFYRDYRIDEFRNRLFIIRDQLFDWAAAGNIEFDNPGYCLVRTTLNGFLRFADSLSLVSVLLSLRTARDWREEEERFVAQMRQAFGTLTPEQRVVVIEKWEQMHREVGRQAILISPLALLLLPPLLLALCLKWAIEKLMPEPQASAPTPAAIASPARRKHHPTDGRPMLAAFARRFGRAMDRAAFAYGSPQEARGPLPV